jgi:hypothetical protein
MSSQKVFCIEKKIQSTPHGCSIVLCMYLSSKLLVHTIEEMEQT